MLTAIWKKLQLCDAQTQYCEIIMCLSDESIKTIGQFDELSNPYDITQILKSLEKMARGSVNPFIERKRFNTRNRREGDTFDTWLTDLRHISEMCDFCTVKSCSEQRFIDRIICGIINADTQQKHFAMENLDLKSTIDFVLWKQPSQTLRHCP